jgi:hypothetical protein
VASKLRTEMKKFIALLIDPSGIYSIIYFSGTAIRDIYNIKPADHFMAAAFEYNEKNIARCKYMKESLNRITKQSKL